MLENAAISEQSGQPSLVHADATFKWKADQAGLLSYVRHADEGQYWRHSDRVIASQLLFLPDSG